jgi:hypothetical protein
MTSTNKTKEKHKGKNASEDSIPSFIRKTYEILEEGKHADVIHWSDDGTAIIINNPTEFAQRVLPAYFKHNNLTSFIRQLNMYDFHKKRSLNMDHVYYHDLFQRGKRHLLKEIRRKNSETTSVTGNGDKTLSPFENIQTRQDLAAVVHENVLLKKINRETLSRVSLLESKIKDMGMENQALWNQIYQFKEKEGLFKNVIISFMKQNNIPISSLPPFLQNDLDFATLNLKDPKDNSPTFVPQSSTKTHFSTGNMGFPSNFPLQQQDLQKVNTLQLVPSHSDSDYTLGNPAQSLYLGNFGKGKSNEQFQGGFGDNKFSTFNFDPNMFQLEDWNATNSSKMNKQSNYPDENLNINLPNKRKLGTRGEDEDLETTKKIKSSPISAFGGNFNANAIPTGSMDIKEEGNTKKGVEVGRASFR